MARSHRERVEAAMEMEAALAAARRASRAMGHGSSRRRSSLQLDALERAPFHGTLTLPDYHRSPANHSTGVSNPAGAQDGLSAAGSSLSATQDGNEEADFSTGGYSLSIFSVFPHTRRSIDCPVGQPSSGWPRPLRPPMADVMAEAPDAFPAATLQPGVLYTLPSAQRAAVAAASAVPQAFRGPRRVMAEEQAEGVTAVPGRPSARLGSQGGPAPISGSAHHAVRVRVNASVSAVQTQLSAGTTQGPVSHPDLSRLRIAVPARFSRGMAPAEARWDDEGGEALVPNASKDRPTSCHRYPDNMDCDQMQQQRPALPQVATQRPRQQQQESQHQRRLDVHNECVGIQEPAPSAAPATRSDPGPESWTGEARLQEWVDWSGVDRALQPPGLMRARAAMVAGATSGDSTLA